MESHIPPDLPPGSCSITKITLWVIDGGKVEREVLQHDTIDSGGAIAFERARQDLTKIRDELQRLLDRGDDLCPFHPSKLAEHLR